MEITTSKQIALYICWNRTTVAIRIMPLTILIRRKHPRGDIEDKSFGFWIRRDRLSKYRPVVMSIGFWKARWFKVLHIKSTTTNYSGMRLTELWKELNEKSLSDKELRQIDKELRKYGDRIPKEILHPYTPMFISIAALLLVLAKIFLLGSHQ